MCEGAHLLAGGLAEEPGCTAPSWCVRECACLCEHVWAQLLPATRWSWRKDGVGNSTHTHGSWGWGRPLELWSKENLLHGHRASTLQVREHSQNAEVQVRGPFSAPRASSPIRARVGPAGLTGSWGWMLVQGCCVSPRGLAREEPPARVLPGAQDNCSRTCRRSDFSFTPLDLGSSETLLLGPRGPLASQSL